METQQIISPVAEPAEPKPVELNFSKKKPQIDRISGVYSGKELLERKSKKIPTLVNPIFPRVGVCALGGSSDTGKSSFLRQLVLDIGTGQKSFLGFKLKLTQNRATYVSTEDDEFATAHMLHKANKKFKLKKSKFEGITFVFDTEILLVKLELLLSNQKVDLIVIDAFSDIYTNSMNDTNQVRTFLNDYSQLAQKYKCLIIFLHHTGKRTEELAPSKNNLLGSQGFEAKMRLVIELRADRSDPKKRHLCIVKGNYLSQKYKQESYVLLFDEFQQFTMTDQRVPFENLKKDNNSDTKKDIIKFKQSGKTQTQIAKELNISQSKVCRILNES